MVERSSALIWMDCQKLPRTRVRGSNPAAASFSYLDLYSDRSNRSAQRKSKLGNKSGEMENKQEDEETDLTKPKPSKNNIYEHVF